MGKWRDDLLLPCPVLRLPYPSLSLAKFLSYLAVRSCLALPINTLFCSTLPCSTFHNLFCYVLPCSALPQFFFSALPCCSSFCNLLPLMVLSLFMVKPDSLPPSILPYLLSGRPAKGRVQANKHAPAELCSRVCHYHHHREAVRQEACLALPFSFTFLPIYLLIYRLSLYGAV